jgi:di/tricarboxylate transporter
MEGLITIIGLCLVFLPFIQFCNYLLNHIVKKTRFDKHLENLKDNSKKMIYLAYLERIVYGVLVSVFGFWMSELFLDNVSFTIFVISLVLYIIIKYFDYQNEVNK